MSSRYVIPRAPFVVDYWGALPSIRLYFLSHMHADHTQGLCDGWNHGLIYCSPISCRLLLHKFRIDPQLVRPLEVGCTHMLFLDTERTQTMNVTLIDANHCPGAVLFLFEGNAFGVILHTGDFR
jgi:DNA cross-link repair 1B protein